jgi:hypothetical protein
MSHKPSEPKRRGRPPADEPRARINAIVSVEQAAKYQRIGASKWLRGAINKAKDKAA